MIKWLTCKRYRLKFNSDGCEIQVKPSVLFWRWRTHMAYYHCKQCYGEASAELVHLRVKEAKK